MLPNKKQNGFVALISVFFFSSIVGLIFFIRTQRLAALDAQFFNAQKQISTFNKRISCDTINRLLATTNEASTTCLVLW